MPSGWSFRMTIRGMLAVLAALAGGSLLGVASPAPAAPPWMTEEAMRTAFIGKTLDGHYGNGITWTEIYLANGRLDYRETTRQAAGYWYFRDRHVFCTFYDPPHRPALTGGCWNALKTSANCYEFYLADITAKEPDEGESGDLGVRWNARAWRQDAPSTCHEKPSA